MRRLIGVTGALAVIAAVPAAAQTTIAQPGTATNAPSASTPAPGQPAQVRTPTPARPNVRQGPNFFGLPLLLPLLGLGGAGAALAASGGGGATQPAAPPASPQ